MSVKRNNTLTTWRRHIGHSIGPSHCRDCQYATMQLPNNNKCNSRLTYLCTDYIKKPLIKLEIVTEMECFMLMSLL